MAYHGMAQHDPFFGTSTSRRIYTIYTDIGRHWDAIYWSDIRRNNYYGKKTPRTSRAKFVAPN
jgi:hypothetical protein